MNLFSLKWEHSSVRGVPYNATAIKAIQKQFFREAVNKFPADIVVAVDSPNCDAEGKRGNLLRVSPPELEHAFLLAVADAITAGKDDDTLAIWKTAMLTCSFHFEVLDAEDKCFYRQITLREQITGKHEAMSSTAVQRVFQIMSLWQYKETTGERQTPAVFAKAWNEHVEMAASSEPVTESFAKNAWKVWTKALSKEPVLEILLRAENKHGHRTPFASLYQIEAYIGKTRTDGQLAFCLSVVLDAIDNGHGKNRATSACGA